MRDLVIGRQRESGLDRGLIQNAGVFAARDISNVSEIEEERFRVLLPVQTYDGTRGWQMAGARRAADRGERPAQFNPGLAVTRVTKAGEPVVSLSLEDRRPGAHHLPARAPGGARSAPWAEASGWFWSILGLWQGTLTSGFAGAIDIEDAGVVSLPIEESIRRFFFRERSSEYVAQKEGAQRVHGGLVEGGEKATEGGTSRQTVTSEERQKRVGPAFDPLVKGFQGAFAADGRAEEHGDKIDHLVTPEAPTGKAHLIRDDGTRALMLQVLSNQAEFSEPARQGWSRSSACLESDRRIRETGQRSSFQKDWCVFLSVGRHIVSGVRYVRLAHCATRGHDHRTHAEKRRDAPKAFSPRVGHVILLFAKRGKSRKRAKRPLRPECVRLILLISLVFLGSELFLQWLS
jgi:hypothetical protein